MIQSVLQTQITAQLRSAGLKPGALVRLKVISRKSAQFWEVKALGKNFTVKSRIPLKPGMEMQARVFKEGDRFLLKVSIPTVKSEIPVADSVRNALVHASMAYSEGLEKALGRFLKSDEFTDHRFIRLYIELYKRGLEIGRDSLDAIRNILADTGEDSQHRKQRKPYQKMEKNRIKALVRAVQEDPHPVHLFNMRLSGNPHWIIVPLQYGRLSGSLRFLLDIRKEKCLKAVVDVKKQDDSRWTVIADLQISGIRLFYPQTCIIGDKTKAQFIRKFQKMGYDDVSVSLQDPQFDGFDTGLGNLNLTSDIQV
jgi:hypothetical protein